MFCAGSLATESPRRQHDIRVGPARCRLDQGLPGPHRLHDGHIDGYAQQQVNSDELWDALALPHVWSGMPSATRKASYHHECERAS